MFDTKKFGAHLSRLRKRADMTQGELGDRLNLTRQAISKYERGESFPDVSILVIIAQIFDTTLDALISAGGPTTEESRILGGVAVGSTEIQANSLKDIVNIAPLVKPSVLQQLSNGLSKHGIDLSNLVELAEYLNDDNVIELMAGAKFGENEMDVTLLQKLMPLLDEHSIMTVFEKILDSELDYRLITAFFDYLPSSLIEAAVLDGGLPDCVLGMMYEHYRKKHLQWLANQNK